jgi:dynamin GTPase
MEESAEEALRREETLRIYNSTKDALKIIADVSRDTIQEPLPPPIKGYDSLPTPTMMK